MDSKFFFNLKSAKIFQAVKWARCPVFSLAQPLGKLFSVLLIFVFLIFLYGFLGENLSNSANSALLGLSIIFLTLRDLFWLENAFFEHKLKRPALSATIKDALEKLDVNLAEFLDFETARAVAAADQFAQSPKSPLTNSACLFCFLLDKSSGLEFIFQRDLLDIREIKSMLKNQLKEYLKKEKSSVGYAQDYQDTIWQSLKIAQKREHEQVVVGDVLSALAIYDPVFQKILMEANLKKEDIENLTWWL